MRSKRCSTSDFPELGPNPFSWLNPGGLTEISPPSTPTYPFLPEGLFLISARAQGPDYPHGRRNEGSSQSSNRPRRFQEMSVAAVLSPRTADVQVRAVLGPRSQPGRLDSASTTFWLFCHSLAWTRQDWGAQRLQVQVKGSVQGGWWREPVARVRHVGRRSSGRVKLPRRGFLRAGRGGVPVRRPPARSLGCRCHLRGPARTRSSRRGRPGRSQSRSHRVGRQ